MAVKILSDSTSYIETEVAKKHNIELISLGINFPEVSFLELNMDNDFFYRKVIEDDVIPTSSQPAQADFFKAFKKIVENGDEVLAIVISAELSGTYQNALGARQMILQEYPEAKIEILDSRVTCMALGYIVIEAAKLAEKEKSLEEVLELAKELIDKVYFYFIPHDLIYLKKGGRIGGAASLIASVLNIKPVLHLHQGRIEVYKKARGMRSAINSIIERMEKDFSKQGLRKVIVHHVNDYAKGQQMAEALPKHFANEIDIINVGPVIGIHVSPGSVGVVYCLQ